MEKNQTLPATAESHFEEGNRLLAAGDHAGAERCFRQSVEIDRGFAEGFANLGYLLDKPATAPEAEAMYRRAITLAPDYFELHMNLGGLLTGQRRFDEAHTAYAAALSLSPDSAAVWSNLGVLHVVQKQESRAEACYRTAISLDANYDKARFNLAYLLLRQDRMEEGWACLEAREWYARLESHFECPRWRGQALSGKSVVITFEAGHGDMIQFCRYAAVLKAQGASRIALICHPALKSLFASLVAVDDVMAFDEDVSRSGWDFWTPPLSLPFLCGTRSDTIPNAIPYLHALPERCAWWALRLPKGGLKVGLVWRGNPAFENDADRSLPDLGVLLPFASVPGVHLISLQKGAGENDALNPPHGMALHHFGSQLRDFAETAAVITNLDLVISVDTAVAHLAGAMGKRCWVLLPDYLTDWRWQVSRTDSPWYPGTMRLFRQPSPGEWAPVIAEVRDALVVLTMASAPPPAMPSA